MSPGTVLEGKYRLVSLLGQGGMGAVWRAEHLVFDAPVAVKLMHAREAASPETRARFDAEAKTAANLRSPHVVQVLDFGIDQISLTPFIVMELMEGESLRERLVRAGPLPPREVAWVMTHVARALTLAHDKNVIHRDLKPANIFLVRNAETEIAKVLDFGIAKSSSRAAPFGATATGMLLGTPYYMSPEQIRSSKNVDFRADLWSFGVIAVECLTGKLPFDADNLAGLALEICESRGTLPSRLGRVPAGFDEWFKRATKLDPNARFESATQMAVALRDVCGVTTEPLAVSIEGRSLEANTSPPSTEFYVGGNGLGQPPLVGSSATPRPQESATPTLEDRTPSLPHGGQPDRAPSMGPLSRTSTFGRAPLSLPQRAGARWPLWAAVIATPLLGIGAFWTLALRDAGPLSPSNDDESEPTSLPEASSQGGAAAPGSSAAGTTPSLPVSEAKAASSPIAAPMPTPPHSTPSTDAPGTSLVPKPSVVAQPKVRTANKPLRLPPPPPNTVTPKTKVTKTPVKTADKAAETPAVEVVPSKAEEKPPAKAADSTARPDGWNTMD